MEAKDWVQSLPVRDREAILRRAEEALWSPKSCRNERTRIAATKLLVACLPKTLSTIRKLLNDKSGRISFERHFTLFCYLDLEDLPQDAKLRKKVLKLIEDYLMTADSNAAHATWMAGDLLGDHWPTPNSLDVLVRVARTAPHQAARESAAYGLAQAARRLSFPRRSSILKVLRIMAEDEADGSVRLVARMSLRNLSRYGIRKSPSRS